jgi:serine/threonine protein phosphatase 1
MLNEMIAPAALPPGLRVYAVGDVHGCGGRLAALHEAIARDAADRLPVPRTVLIHLGDYVDRGPESAAVIERLLGPSPLPGAEVVNLLGNHEVMMLDAFDPRSAAGAIGFWLDNGGEATLASYGATPEDADSWDLVPQAHLDFLGRCELSRSAGGYLFVHAGVRPGVALEHQDPFDLVWIREPFLAFRGDLGAVVVHGHTPCPRPEVLPHRIGIDTGAVFGGALTCLVLEGRRMGFLTA